MTKILSTICKIAGALGYTCLFWWVTQYWWNPPPSPLGISVSMPDPGPPDVTWMVALAGIVAYWITSDLCRKQKWVGFGLAVAVVLSPFVLLQSVKIFLRIVHNPAELPHWSGTVLNMFLMVIPAVCLVALGWGGSLAAGRFFGRVMKDVEALGSEIRLVAKAG